MADNKEIIARRLAAGGLNRKAIAGILGNLEGESAFNPKADNGNHWGIAQWDAGRWAKLRAFANKRGESEWNVALQADFIVHELTTGEGGTTIGRMNGKRNAYQAGFHFADQYERGGHEDERGAAARRYVSIAKRAAANPGKSTGRTYTWVPKETGHNYNTFGEPNPRYEAGHHTGNDISAPYGSPIRWAAPGSGKVLWVKEGGDYGLHMLIRDDKGREWLFAHMSGTSLQKGDRVGQGERIGKVGNSGTSYSGTDGAHLHLEQTLPNKHWDYDTNLKNPKLVFGQGKGITPDAGVDVKPSDFLSQLGVPRSWLDNPGMEQVREIVEKAARNDWSEQRFMWKLRETDWYINRTDAQRKFDMLQSKDQAQQVEVARTSVRKSARQFGITLTDKQIDREALSIARNGDSPEQVQAWVARKYVYDPAKGQPGLTAAFQEQLMDIAAEYGLTLSNKQLQRWTRDYIAADANPEDYEQKMRERAQAMYPGLDLGNGTLREALDPYLQVASRELGIDIDKFDLTDPKWVEVFNPDDKSQPMSTWDWRKKIVSDSRYGWDSGEKGHGAALSLATALGSIFGGTR